MPTRNAVLLAVLIATAGLVVLAQNPKDAISPAAIMQSEGDLQHPTPRQECRFLIHDSHKRLWTLGVESDGSQELNSTRQAIVLGRFEGVHWSQVERLVDNWWVYSPTAAADDKGGLWIAWSEWNQPQQFWIIRALYWNGKKIRPAPPSARYPVGPFTGNELRPTLALESNGRPIIAYEFGVHHHFELHTSTFDGQKWNDETVATKDSNFRPSIAIDKTGRTWLAWDRFAGNRTFAIRGGEPMLIEFQVNDQFMGGELAAHNQPLRATVRVAAHSAIQKIEIVRDGRYVYTRPGEKQMEVRFDFTDSEHGKYYYVRVWLDDDKYAWTSPVFVD